MKKLLLLLALVFTTMSFAGNLIPGNARKVERPCGVPMPVRKVQMPNALCRTEKTVKDKLTTKEKLFATFKKASKYDLNQGRAADNETRLDSIVVKEADGGKALEREIYEYYPIHQYNGDLHVMTILNYENDEFHGASMTGKYDEYGNTSELIVKESHEEGGEWINVYKYETGYTSFGAFTMDNVYNWEDEIWKGASSTLYEYNNQNRETKRINYEWDHAKNKWGNPMEKVETTYSNLLITEITSNYENGEWIVIARNEYHFDENGNQIKLAGFVQNPATLELYENYRDEVTYDEDSNMLEKIGWNAYEPAEPLAKSSRETYTYENGLETVYQFDYPSATVPDSWDPYSKSVMTYADTITRPATATDYEWGITAWVPISKLVTTFNKQALISEQIISEWDGEKETWIPAERQTDEYDAKGQGTIRYNYLYVDNDWEKVGEMFYTYNEEGKQTSFELSFLGEDGEWQYDKTEQTYNAAGKILENRVFVWSDGAFVWDTSGYYYYSDPTSIKSLPVTQTKLSVTAGQLLIENNDGETCIYKVDGQMVYRSNLEKLQVHLQEGLYLVRTNAQVYKVFIP